MGHSRLVSDIAKTELRNRGIEAPATFGRWVRGGYENELDNLPGDLADYLAEYLGIYRQIMDRFRDAGINPYKPWKVYYTRDAAERAVWRHAPAIGATQRDAVIHKVGRVYIIDEEKS